MKQDKIYYGGDYNPDQWPEEILEQDIPMFQKAGINLVTLPVFSWAKLQPSEEVYCFDWLDRVIDRLWRAGISVCLSTPTAAQPAWMSRKYPDMLPVDISGLRRTHGKRVNFCPNSPDYRRFSTAIAEKMGERYGKHPAVVLWHVANEYGTYCYCPQCERKFREWLKDRYHTVEELNARWNLSFWGHTVYDWDEVVIPSERNDDYRFYQPVYLDYRRFMTDSNLDCFRAEYNILKKYSPDIPITTNISGFIQQLDQMKFCKHVDIAGWDNYPWPTDPPARVAMKHDLMRGLKQGKPYLMVEQAPSQQNWQPYNVQKRPGELRRLSYQAMAHGADSVMYFQMRQSVAGVEKFHSALISHAGHENTRVFREMSQIGRELAALGGQTVGAVSKNQAAILFDWDNWWAAEGSNGPSRDLKYLEQVEKYYTAFYKRNIPVDFVSMEDDLSGYRVLVTPMLYMVKPGCGEKLREFVKKGGTLLTTVFSGIVDENDRVPVGGYPGELSDILGIWVEETDALRPEQSNRIVGKEAPFVGSFSCGLLCDVIHLTAPDTEALCVFGEDYYKDFPCVTCHPFGEGTAYYVGTNPEERFADALIGKIAGERGLRPVLEASEIPEGIEITCRENENGRFYYLLSFRKGETAVNLARSGKDFINAVTGEKVGDSLLMKEYDCFLLRER